MAFKILMLKGLPASGKSTYAKKLVDSGNWKRINKDDLRAMLDNSKWSKKNERLVLSLRNAIIYGSIGSGFNVVVDDTNFHPSHRRDLEELAERYGATFEEKFFDTPVEECIKRDLTRPASVGERVIRKMYKDYLKPKPQVIEYDPDLPECIICDIDGTLAHMDGRSPYEWSKVGDDQIDLEIQELLTNYWSPGGPTIILLSGRDGSCRKETEAWLEKHGVNYDHLYMRTADDTRKDSIVKEELYRCHIFQKYNVKFVLDDRNQVVDMWRSLGLKCLQVAEGDF